MIDTLKYEEFDNAQIKIGYYCSKIGGLLYFFSSKMQTISKKRSKW